MSSSGIAPRGGGRRRGCPARSRRPPAPSAATAPRRAPRATRRAAARRTAPRARRAIRFSWPTPVALGQRREDRLVVAAAQELHLAARDEAAQPVEQVGALGARATRSSGPGVVERDPDAGMALQRLDHRLVGLVVDLVEHPAEVADRLVVVDRQGERDRGGHRSARRRSCRRDPRWRRPSALGPAPRPRRRRRRAPATPAPAGTAARRTRGASAWSRSARSCSPSTRRIELDPASRQPVLRRARSSAARSRPRGAGTGPARRPSPGRLRRRSSRGRRWPSRCRRVALVPPAVEHASS